MGIIGTKAKIRHISKSLPVFADLPWMRLTPITFSFMGIYPLSNKSSKVNNQRIVQKLREHNKTSLW
jgi:hypothetical protein